MCMYMQQYRVKIEHSVAYFDHITTFKVSSNAEPFVKGGAQNKHTGFNCVV